MKVRHDRDYKELITKYVCIMDTIREMTNDLWHFEILFCENHFQ